MTPLAPLAEYSIHSVDIAHLIQVALTPIFLISAIGVTLGVLTSRLARIVDRARSMEDLLHGFEPQAGRDLHDQLGFLERRARLINAAITLITLSALFIALVVVMLFVNAFLRWDLSVFIACMFIVSMLSLAAALLAFLIEVRIATTTLRIGLHPDPNATRSTPLRVLLFAALVAGLATGAQVPMARGEDNAGSPAATKPEAAAGKIFLAGEKSLEKAREFAAIAAKAPNPDKKAKALDKAGENYDRALDQFTEALRNKGDMYQAWNDVGYVHLHLGAFAEALDDYNHTLALKPDLLEAMEGRGEAYLGVDRLDEAKSAYLYLLAHARDLAGQLLPVMRKWLASHRTEARGVRATDLDAFDKWLQERAGSAQ